MHSITSHNIAMAILARRHEAVGLMHRFIGCGPFDGGCVILSHALQAAFGGDVYSVEGRWHVPGFRRIRSGEVEWKPPLQAHHTVLRLPQDPSSGGLGAIYADADGVRDGEEELLDMFIGAEGDSGGFTDLRLRPFVAGDLPDCARSPHLVDVISRLFGGSSLPDESSLRGAWWPTQAGCQPLEWGGGSA